ncbi:MAG TPA: hypothetical protein VHF25_17350, partial [Nitriliruptorales bacterium]|nr:hypothetical protein [Nitriliruptorales bacterium]
ADLAQPSFVEARRRLAARGGTWDWRTWLAGEDLVLDLGQLAWWSWWLTPHGVHRRYSTRFFVAPVPADQVGAHDRVETVSSRWITPHEVLDAADMGQVTVVYPTRENLRALAAHGSAASVVAAARAGRVDLRPHLPQIVRDGDRILVRHPYTGELDLP